MARTPRFSSSILGRNRECVGGSDAEGIGSRRVEYTANAANLQCPLVPTCIATPLHRVCLHACHQERVRPVPLLIANAPSKATQFLQTTVRSGGRGALRINTIPGGHHALIRSRAHCASAGGQWKGDPGGRRDRSHSDKAIRYAKNPVDGAEQMRLSGNALYLSWRR